MVTIKQAIDGGNDSGDLYRDALPAVQCGAKDHISEYVSEPSYTDLEPTSSPK